MEKRERLDEREQKLPEAIKKISFGEIKVIINDGKPVRIEEVRRGIKLIVLDLIFGEHLEMGEDV